MLERTAPPRPRGRAGMIAAGLVALAMPAAGEGWSIYKLDSFESTDACMAKARTVISHYMFDHGGAETGADSWSVYGYDLDPGLQDAVIVCPEGPDGLIDAMLIVQSESESEERVQVAEELVRIWDGD